MIKAFGDLYGRLLRGFIILAAAGALSSMEVSKAAKTASESVRTGLINLKGLNARLGM